MHEAEKLPATAFSDPDLEPKDPLIGTVLLKRYEVLEQIGTGRFSVVYKARQLLMNRVVAIKSLKRDLLDEKEVVARFKKEARALSRLRHPNIVAVFDCFESQNGRPYLVMDFLEGMSLEDLLAKDHALSAEMAKPILLQICDALQHAHKHGVLHRDLKPGNMVLLAEAKGAELVQLVDFGLAQVEEEVQKLTQDGECCGSPAYMSPEHCTGEPLDGRSDIYSLGVVMYEVLTGVVPFKGRTSVETMRLQVYENPPPLRKVRPDLSLPSDIEETVMRCLHKEPHKRFQTAQQVKESVQNWGKAPAQGRPIIAPPTAGTFSAEPADNRSGHAASEHAMAPVYAPEPQQAPIIVPSAKTKEWASAGHPGHRDSHENIGTTKMKKWTDTQQKAETLRLPILVGCIVAAMVLAVLATLIFMHPGAKGPTEEAHSNSAANDNEPVATSGTTQRPTDVDVPPSTLASTPDMASEALTTSVPIVKSAAATDLPKPVEPDNRAPARTAVAVQPVEVPPVVKSVTPVEEVPVIKPAKPQQAVAPAKPKATVHPVAPPAEPVAPPKTEPAKPAPVKATPPNPAQAKAVAAATKPTAPPKKAEPPKAPARKESVVAHHAKPTPKAKSVVASAKKPAAAAKPAAPAASQTASTPDSHLRRHAYSSYGF